MNLSWDTKNKQKSITFLFTITMPFTAAPKKMIYLGINVTKYRGSVYWKLQNTDDEIKGLNNWKDSVYWLESNTVKILIIPKLFYRCNVIPRKIFHRYR